MPTGENFLSPPLYALGALCGGPSFRLTTEGSGDTRGQERKTRFRLSVKPLGPARRPGSMG